MVEFYVENLHKHKHLVPTKVTWTHMSCIIIMTCQLLKTNFPGGLECSMKQHDGLIETVGNNQKLLQF